ncbi:hypothetical protein FV141_14230 (plasmid) [Dermacoccus abyssi]|uniref:ParB-like N-terminal domain-containing protein n=1 Tax=Dermacoccus abyssi TaxID=322596 RepID=A0ABX5ZDA3_9MICO|nr:hypothetical protein FV141_14230 [Dermacoccus abyssi]
MAEKKTGLGGAPLQRRGPKARKSASLVSAVRTQDESSVLYLALSEIADNPENPEARVQDVAELADSMREVGQLQPGLVVDAGEFVAEYPQHAEAVAGRAWVLLAGHRRRAGRAGRRPSTRSRPCDVALHVSTRRCCTRTCIARR